MNRGEHKVLEYLWTEVSTKPWNTYEQRWAQGLEILMNKGGHMALKYLWTEVSTRPWKYTWTEVGTRPWKSTWTDLGTRPWKVSLESHVLTLCCFRGVICLYYKLPPCPYLVLFYEGEFVYITTMSLPCVVLWGGICLYYIQPCPYHVLFYEGEFVYITTVRMKYWF